STALQKMTTMRSLLAAVLVLSAGCSVDSLDCGPAPQPNDAFLEFTKPTGNGQPRIGEEQSVYAGYQVRWSAGCVYPEDINASCDCSSEELTTTADFEVTDAQCDDGACDVTDVGPIVYEEREIRVILRAPSATLHVHATSNAGRAPGDFSPVEPDADG